MCITSTTITMSSSLAEHQINAGIITEAAGSSSSSGRLHQFMRTSSSLSTASSDFEFDSNWSFSELNDHEPPLSPKLNYSPNWEIAGLAAANQHFAERETAFGSMNSSNVVPQGHEAGLPNDMSASRRGLNDVISVNDGIKEGLGAEISTLSRRLDDVISVNDGIKGDDYGGEQRRRVNLRSLLDRRDVEQLPPLNYKKYSPQMKKDLQVSSSPSPSSSASSSPLHQYSEQYCNRTTPCRNDDDHPCTPCKSNRSYEKKCKKWAFNLDFLRRTVPSSRADNNHRQLNQTCSSDQASNYGLNRRCSSDQASNYGLNQRCSSDLEAAASNYGKIERHGRMGANEDDEQVINYSGAAGPAVIRKFESPRKSTGSSRNGVISSVAKGGGNKYESKSAPISPAASPPRSAAAGGGGGGGASPPAHRRGAAAAASPRWAPMSPHALHYQQQKARAEELRKKTFLPYRQSLLGSCFFPADHIHSTPAAAPPPAHPYHAVYC